MWLPVGPLLGCCALSQAELGCVWVQMILRERREYGRNMYCTTYFIVLVSCGRTQSDLHWSALVVATPSPHLCLITRRVPYSVLIATSTSLFVDLRMNWRLGHMCLRGNGAYRALQQNGDGIRRIFRRVRGLLQGELCSYLSLYMLITTCACFITR